MEQTLTTFRETLAPDPSLNPVENQRRAKQLLPGRINQSPLSWWSKGVHLPKDERFLLIGVAAWSRYDINLLDVLAQGIHADQVIPIYVFDTDELSQEQLEALLPGIGIAHHTPIVGFWEQGKLTGTACGNHGRKMIARLLELDESNLQRRVTSVS